MTLPSRAGVHARFDTRPCQAIQRPTQHARLLSRSDRVTEVGQSVFIHVRGS